jgi:predicted nucleotide-binding protein (sugar kinase/HSP70/actin superfamily)
MATKQFKIGEYVVGGIIQVTTNKNQIEINFNDYFSKEKILSETFILTSNTLRSDIMNFIEDNGTHYYADQVMKWIESKVDIKTHSFFPNW